MRVIETLLSDIWESLDCGPTKSSISPFVSRLHTIDFKDFIIYNFTGKAWPMPDKMLLATFDFWKSFNLKDWKEIFEAVSGNEYGEYYMSVFATNYLGLNPGFGAGIQTTTHNIAGINQKKQTVAFVGDLEGEVREAACEDLFEDYEITLNDLAKLNERLVAESEAN